MYNSFTGVVTAKNVDSLYLLVYGIEYTLLVSQHCLQNLPVVGKEAKVYSYLHHKEDIMLLYGFYNEMERRVFMNLVAVNGVGPKLALKILSYLALNDLLLVLDRNDAAGLSKVPGVGLKTAQKIILQLQDHLVHFEENAVGKHHDLATSLVAMGYNKRDCMQIVNQLMVKESIATLPFEEQEAIIMKEAIIFLTSNSTTS